MRNLKNTFTFDRTLLALALVKGLVEIWWKYDPTPVVWVGAILVGVAMTLATDKFIQTGNAYSERLGRLLAVFMFGGAFVSSPWLIGTFSLMARGVNAAVPAAARIKDLFVSDALPLVKASIPSLKSRTFLSHPICAFSARHGAYGLHPITQSLLFFQ
jgi:hypothetical protein